MPATIAAPSDELAQPVIDQNTLHFFTNRRGQLHAAGSCSSWAAQAAAPQSHGITAQHGDIYYQPYLQSKSRAHQTAHGWKTRIPGPLMAADGTWVQCKCVTACNAGSPRGKKDGAQTSEHNMQAGRPWDNGNVLCMASWQGVLATKGLLRHDAASVRMLC